VILTEELSAFPFRQIPQNDLRIIRFLGIERLSGHSASLRPGTDSVRGKTQHEEEQWAPRPPPLAPAMMQNGDQPPAALIAEMHRDPGHTHRQM
jgi:hypothetical protein